MCPLRLYKAANSVSTAEIDASSSSDPKSVYNAHIKRHERGITSGETFKDCNGSRLSVWALENRLWEITELEAEQPTGKLTKETIWKKPEYAEVALEFLPWLEKHKDGSKSAIVYWLSSLKTFRLKRPQKELGDIFGFERTMFKNSKCDDPFVIDKVGDIFERLERIRKSL